LDKPEILLFLWESQRPFKKNWRKALISFSVLPSAMLGRREHAAVAEQLEPCAARVFHHEVPA
jgi:hypothetical protein